MLRRAAKADLWSLLLATLFALLGVAAAASAATPTPTPRITPTPTATPTPASSITPTPTPTPTGSTTTTTATRTPGSSKSATPSTTPVTATTIYVTDEELTAVLEFAAHSSSTAKPTKTINGPLTEMSFPSGVFVDAHQNVFVSNLISSGLV